MVGKRSVEHSSIIVHVEVDITWTKIRQQRNDKSRPILTKG